MHGLSYELADPTLIGVAFAIGKLTGSVTLFFCNGRFDCDLLFHLYTSQKGILLLPNRARVVVVVVLVKLFWIYFYYYCQLVVCFLYGKKHNQWL